MSKENQNEAQPGLEPSAEELVQVYMHARWRAVNALNTRSTTVEQLAGALGLSVEAVEQDFGRSKPELPQGMITGFVRLPKDYQDEYNLALFERAFHALGNWFVEVCTSGVDWDNGESSKLTFDGARTATTDEGKRLLAIHTTTERTEDL